MELGDVGGDAGQGVVTEVQNSEVRQGPQSRTQAADFTCTWTEHHKSQEVPKTPPNTD